MSILRVNNKRVKFINIPVVIPYVNAEVVKESRTTIRPIILTFKALFFINFSNKLLCKIASLEVFNNIKTLIKFNNSITVFIFKLFM